MLKKVFVAVFLLLGIASVVAAPVGPSYGLVDYVDLGQVSNSLSFSTGENLTVLDEARVAELPINGNPLGQWRTMELDPASQNVSEYLSSESSNSSLIYPGEVRLDISDLDGGEYAVFLWACERNGSSGSCRWLKPRKFTKPGGSNQASAEICDPSPSIDPGKHDIVRENSEGVYSPNVNDCPSSLVDSYKWEVSRDGEVIEETRWRSTDSDFTFSPRSEENFNLTLRVRSEEEEENGSTTMEIWAVPEIPGNMLLSAHRGGYHAPHNTVMTMEQSRKAGVNSVEYDVRRTGDGEFVVIHDKTTGKFSTTDLDVSQNDLEDITDLHKGEHYTNEGDALDVDKETARQSQIPSLSEVLDYVQNHDLHQRIEFKGDLQGNREWGKEVYEEVRSRGLLDQTVFLSFRGGCPSNTGPDASDCRWHGLEGVIEAGEEDGNDVTTGMLYANRNLHGKPDVSVPTSVNDVTNVANEVGDKALGAVDLVEPSEAIQYAENQNIDIIVAADGNPEGLAGGLAGSTQMSRGEFVEEAMDADLGYAFMYFRSARDMNKKKHMAKCGVEWWSTNDALAAMNNIKEFSDESLAVDREYCDFTGDHQVSKVEASMRILGRGEVALEQGLSYPGDAASWTWDYSFESVNRGIEGTSDLIRNPSLGNLGESLMGAGDQLSEPVDVMGDTIREDGGRFVSGVDNTIGDIDEATQSEQDWVVEGGRQWVNDPVEQGSDVGGDVADTAGDACDGAVSTVTFGHVDGC